MENNIVSPLSAKFSPEYSKYSPHADNSTVSTQLVKQKFSQSSFQTPQLSVFSTSLLSTTARAQNLLNKFKAAVPIVNIQSIIKQKPYLYMDKSLEHNFDELLQKGYSLVVVKKNEQISQKELEDQLIECIHNTEQEIVPEINKGNSLRENITHQKVIADNLRIDINQLKDLINNFEQQIIYKREAVQTQHENLVQTIQICQNENFEIQKQIKDNIAQHSMNRTQYEQEIGKYKNQLEELLNQLTKLQGKYDTTKFGQGDRRRKIENKSKMFMGILNH